MRISTVFIWLFGILLPVIALSIELGFHICAQGVFNPIPTPLHIALVAFVPLGNFYIWMCTRSPDYKPRLIDFLIVSTVISISGCYAIAFAPFSLLGAFLCIYFGIGFLPLAPLLSCISGIYLLRVIWRKKTGAESFFGRSIWSAGGLCMIFCCIGGILWSGLADERYFHNIMNMWH